VSREDLQQDLKLARGFQPMARDEIDALLAKARPDATDGRYELFKSTQEFDGPHHRAQHGFKPA
jgi:hypothetical protein